MDTEKSQQKVDEKLAEVNRCLSLILHEPEGQELANAIRRYLSRRFQVGSDKAAAEVDAL